MSVVVVMPVAPTLLVMMMTEFLKSTCAALRIGQAAVFEHLQQQVEDVGVRLLDFVEQHDGVGPPSYRFGELAALFVADVSGRRADESANRVLLHVLRHVDPNHRLFIVEHERGHAARDLGFADAGRPEEDERADRPLRVLETRARTPDRPRDHSDRFVLPDDALVEQVAHPSSFSVSAWASRC